MSDAKIIIGDNFESGGGSQTIAKDQATLIQAKEVHLSSRQLAPPIVPCDLQPLDACFLGRDRELAALLEQLQPGRVAAVCGSGGMGKSALAAQAVHQLKEDHFPDGIVFYSFYGHPETEQALQYIAEAFQVEAKASLANTVRQTLSGKKALLILDGTEEAEDLKAVLDLRSTCGVLITSRKRDDAQSFRLDLTPLEDEPAVEVLREHSGLVGDDEAVQGICKILDGWPMGLRIAGRYLGSRGESAADYLRWLEKRPFRKLKTGKHQEDNAALLLERSVEQVSADAVQTLRLAGVLAFAPIRFEPVMAVLYEENEDMDELELRSIDALGELIRYGLLETTEKGWKISHALIHTYARTKLALSKEALIRLAKYYIAFCRTQIEAGLAGYARLNEERTHYLQLMQSCLKSELWQEEQYLEGAISEYLDRQGYWIELRTALEIRLTAAKQSGNQEDEGLSLHNLGYTCERCGEYEKALAWYKQSLTIARELSNRKGEGVTLNNIGEIYRKQGNHELALQRYEQSLSIARDVGDQNGEAGTLNNIGLLCESQDDYEAALQLYEQCLPIWQKLSCKTGKGETLNNIAIIYHIQGNHAKSLEFHRQALVIRQVLGERAGEALSHWNIGRLYEDHGDLIKAAEHIVQAVEIAEAISHPSLEKWREELERMRAERHGA